MRPSPRVAVVTLCLTILSLLTYYNFTYISSSVNGYILQIHDGYRTDAKSPGSDTSSEESDDWTEIKNMWSADAEKVVVMAKMESEQTDWVAENLPDWHHALYHMDAPAPNDTLTVHHYTPPINKGREAMAYLTFLVDHYHALPKTMAFLHSHQKGWPAGWHTDAADYDNVNALRSLHIDYIQKEGYANLRCNYNPGCPAEIQPFREPKDESRTSEIAMVGAWKYMFANSSSSSSTTPSEASPLETTSPSTGDSTSQHTRNLHRLLTPRLFFSDSSNNDNADRENTEPEPSSSSEYLVTSPEVPKVIAAACCSQFAVSRNQVLRRPREDYVRFRDWLIETPLTDDVSGRVMEYLWHVYFGKDSVQYVCP